VGPAGSTKPSARNACSRTPPSPGANLAAASRGHDSPRRQPSKLSQDMAHQQRREAADRPFRIDVHSSRILLVLRRIDGSIRSRGATDRLCRCRLVATSGVLESEMIEVQLRFLIVLAAVLPIHSANRIDTFAGGVIRSGVPAKHVLLGTVNGTTWDSAGNLVFGDIANNVLRRVRTDGVIQTIAGTGVYGFSGDGGPASRALMNGPASPCYDSMGNLYFADFSNYRIRRIDPKGIITTVAGNGAFGGKQRRWPGDGCFAGFRGHPRRRPVRKCLFHGSQVLSASDS